MSKRICIPMIHADPIGNVLPSAGAHDLARRIAATISAGLNCFQCRYHLMPYRVDGEQVLALDLTDECGNSYAVTFLPGTPAFDQVNIGSRNVDVDTVDMVDALLLAQLIVAAVASPLPANGNLGAAIGHHWPPVSSPRPGSQVECIHTPPAEERPEDISWPE